MIEIWEQVKANQYRHHLRRIRVCGIEYDSRLARADRRLATAMRWSVTVTLMVVMIMTLVVLFNMLLWVVTNA